MKVYFRLLNYAKKYKSYLLSSIILSVLFSIFSGISVYLTIPLLKTLFLSQTSQADEFQSSGISNFVQEYLKIIEDYIFEGGTEAALFKVCVLILLAFLLKNITGFFQAVSMQKVEKSVVRDIRVMTYEKINSLSLRYFTTERSGNLISRMTNDVNAIQNAISATFLNLMREPLLILIFLVLALSISWQMTIIALLVFPFTVIIITKIGASLKRRSIRMQEKSSDLVTIVSETIYGAKIIRTFLGEKFKNKIFKKESDELLRLTMRSTWANEMANPITEFLTIIAGIAIIWFGGREILINRTLEPAEFLGFLFIIFQLIVPIKNLGTVNNRIQEASASGARIFEITDQPIEIMDSQKAVDKDSFEECIELKNVSFNYEKDKVVLQNIDLKINKSEIVAIVGPSGGGKSTLVDLISRFYDVTNGEILIDGTTIKNRKIRSLRKLIGIVQQEIILFNDTIRNNIIFGKETVSEDELIKTCKLANAYDFIMETEKGFDSITGERGLKLSGGQKQRISIARALLRNPQILILDEATSSLDTESEMLVQDALERLMTSRTSLVIAHRLSTVRNADRIVVINEGKISQIGTHEELIKTTDGVYKKLYDLQFN